MADLFAHDSIPSNLTVHVDSLLVFDEVAITDPTELAALYLPLPKNLVVQVDELQEFVDQAIPAPTDLDGRTKP